MAAHNAERLTRWAGKIFESCGIAADHAALTAISLVDASLRGIDTHGISRVPSYVELLELGESNAQPDIRIEQRGWLLDVAADRALGQIAGSLATDAAIALARDNGCAICVIRDTGHLGALGYFTRRAADAGFLAIMMQNAPALMSLPGSTARAIGNNPMSFAAPLPEGPPVVFDMAASEAAFGKVIEAARAGKPIPQGWSLDASGQPTTDSRAALGGMLLPMAGPKGIGLAMMVESFAGALTGTQPAKMKGGNRLSYGFGAFMLVLDPGFIQEKAAFDAHMSEWVGIYRASSPDARYPGQRTAEIHETRNRDGIPLNDEVTAALDKVGAERGIKF